MSTTLSHRNNGTIDAHNTYFQASANLITAYPMTPQKNNQSTVLGGTNQTTNRTVLASCPQYPTTSYQDDEFVQLRSEDKAHNKANNVASVPQVQKVNATETTNSESDQPSADLWTALYDYEAQNEDELSLSRGTVVVVLSKDSNISGDEGWWTGKIGDKVGIFPCNYVTDRDMLTVDELPGSIGDVELIQIDYKDLTLKEVIGRGGFNEVRLAYWREQEVAVKTPYHNQTRETVLTEAKLCWTLSHKNIVALLGVCLQQPVFRLVIEYAHGGPLNKILAKHKIPPDVLVGWAKQIADGMNYLHNGAPICILHRDLKSENGKF